MSINNDTINIILGNKPTPKIIKMESHKLMPFPANELNLTNGTVLAPTGDMYWASLVKDQQFSIYFDGKYIRAGSLTWAAEQLCGEIKNDYWKIISL
jgi:hypothetical protein